MQERHEMTLKSMEIWCMQVIGSLTQGPQKLGPAAACYTMSSSCQLKAERLDHVVLWLCKTHVCCRGVRRLT